jgi:hypothetical protein
MHFSRFVWIPVDVYVFMKIEKSGLLLHFETLIQTPIKRSKQDKGLQPLLK